MAGAKLSFRLVPDQDPKTVAELFRDHVRDGLPAGRHLRDHRAPRRPRRAWSTSTAPASTRPCAPSRPASARRPVFIREGGSIPVVGLLKTQLGVDTLLLGWGQNDDNLHGPEREVLAGRLPPRHQVRRPPAGRAGPTNFASPLRQSRPVKIDETTDASRGVRRCRPRPPLSNNCSTQSSPCPRPTAR